MKCDEAREQLEQWFDDGAGFSSETEAHLAQCDPCRSYRDELAAVQDALGHLPVEAPAPGLAGRVKTHLAAHGPIRDAQMPVAAGWALAAGALVTASVAGWFLPVSVDLGAWWNVAVADVLGRFPPLPVDVEAWRHVAITCVPEMDWRQAASSLSSQLDALSGSVTPWIGEFTGWVPPGMLWLGVIFAAMLLIGCNGFEALRLRTTSVDGSEQAS